MPMPRKMGMPCDSMKWSYGVLGRLNLPKPARVSPVGSCQCVLRLKMSCICNWVRVDFATTVARHYRRGEKIDSDPITCHPRRATCSLKPHCHPRPSDRRERGEGDPGDAGLDLTTLS